jgi:hypothetical protein
MAKSLYGVECSTGIFRVWNGFRSQRGSNGEGLERIILGQCNQEIVRVREDGRNTRKWESESVTHWVGSGKGERKGRGSQTGKQWRVGMCKAYETM